MDTAIDMVVLEGNRVHDLDTGAVVWENEQMSIYVHVFVGGAPI